MNVAPSQLQSSAAQEILRRRAALESLADFRVHMVSTGSEDFKHVPAQHHQLIASHLERLERGEIQRLLILAPPGSAKSTYCSIQYPLWRLAKKPNENILCASNTQDLAESFNRRRRNVALTLEWQTLAGTKLAADLQGAGHFGTERQGSVRAAGVSSSVVGFRSHLNILDDPIRGVEEAMSSTVLDKHWEWFTQEFRTRLVPGGKELIVSTRWAKRDIAGRILQLVREGKEEWTVLRLPMIADSEDDPLHRPLGGVLWPDYFTPAHVALKQQNPLLWMTQFQQTPLDESGVWIGQEHVRYEAAPPADLRYVIAVDLALTVGRGDFTVIAVAGLDAERVLHVVHVERFRLGPEQTVHRLFQLCADFNPNEVLIDDDNASKVFTRLLFELARSRGVAPPPLKPIPMRGKDKETRAAALRGFFLAGQVRIVTAPWNGELPHELLEFPSGDHDDQVDALGLIGRRFPMLSAPQNSQPKSQDAYDGYLIRQDDMGRQFVNVSLDQLFEDSERDGRFGRHRI